MGAPIGNENARRGTEWRDALRRAAKKFKTETVRAGKVLDAIAQELLRRALAGDIEAIREIGNRFDGKPGQPVDLSGDLSIDSPRASPLRIILPFNGRADPALLGPVAHQETAFEHALAVAERIAHEKLNDATSAGRDIAETTRWRKWISQVFNAAGEVLEREAQQAAKAAKKSAKEKF